MEEFTLINKQRNRIKYLSHLRILVIHLQLLKQWKFNTLASIKDRVNQLLKGQELNLLKMQERNISSYWKRVGRRQVYLKVIFKKVLINLLHTSKLVLSLYQS